MKETSLRESVIRLAYVNPRLRPFVLPLFSRIARGSTFTDFMEVEGDKKVHNPDTGNTVEIKSLKGPKGQDLVQRLFHDWQGKKETPKQEVAPQESLGLKKDRYKDKMVIPDKDTDVWDSSKLSKSDPHSKNVAQVISAFTKGSTKLPAEFIADLMGLPIVATGRGTFTMHTYVGKHSPVDNGLSVNAHGGYIEEMARDLRVDADGSPYIYNDTIVLSDKAPKGMGTKIFASEVAQAQAAGVKSIRCLAFREKDNPDWVGYKVWPKLGYDGPVPFDKPAQDDGVTPVAPPLPPEIEGKLKKAGFKKPVMVSHLYQVEGGMEWWEENGVAFHATFDLAANSNSMKVLSAYIQAKAKKAKQEPEEWLAKLASQSRDKKKRHENLDLEEDDHALLQDIWKRFRK